MVLERIFRVVFLGELDKVFLTDFENPLTRLTVSALLLFVLSNILFGELNMVFSSRFSRIMLHRRTFWCGYWLILLCLQHFPNI